MGTRLLPVQTWEDFCSHLNVEVIMTKLTKDLKSVVSNVNGGIVIPAAMYLMGVPLVVVVLAWLLFFRG